MFEIKTTTNEVIDGGTLAISWCVDQELLKKLSDATITDPQIVIVVAPQGANYNSRKEWRTVVPMKDLIAYVNFRVSGENKVFAFITYYDHKLCKGKYLPRTNGEYDTTVLDWDGSAINGSTFWEQSVPLSVNVPAECFAKEPPAWEKAWVNYFWRGKPEDQCDYRKRRLLAYSVQPIVLLGNWLTRLLVFVFALGIGTRNLTLAPLFRLLSMDLDDCLNWFEDGSAFVRNLPEDAVGGGPSTFANGFQAVSWFLRKMCLLPLTPFIWAIMLMLGIFAKHGALIALCLFGAVVVLVLLIAFFGFIAEGGILDVIEAIADLIIKGARNRTLRVPANTSSVPWYLRPEEQELLVCSNQTGPMTFDKLPKQHKSIRLRLQNVKSKVCRPFSA